METYKHILEILTINKVCLFMSYDTMDYLFFVIWYEGGKLARDKGGMIMA